MVSGFAYNKKHDAYESKCEIWGKRVVIYVTADSETALSDNLGELKSKLSRINRNKEKLAKIIIRDGWVNKANYTAEQLEEFAAVITISELTSEITEDGITCRFVIDDDRKFMDNGLAFDMEEDNSIEILGWD